MMDDLGSELGKAELPSVHVGDTVSVHYLIKEGEKERVQIFSGTVLSIQGRTVAKSIIVRRIVQGEGVERAFPLHSPRVKDVQITRRGKVRQARLYYLRDRVGKQTRVEELLGEKAKRLRQLTPREPEAQATPPPPADESSDADTETEAIEV